jgi:hypothetical protein
MLVPAVSGQFEMRAGPTAQKIIVRLVFPDLHCGAWLLG